VRSLGQRELVANVDSGTQFSPKQTVYDVTCTRGEFSRGKQMTDSEQTTVCAVTLDCFSDTRLRGIQCTVLPSLIA